LAETRGCQNGFDQCAGACRPGEPPQGVAMCKAEGKSALQGDLASCKLTFQVTAIACFNKDVTCVQSCADTRVACNAPARSVLDAALAVCRMQEASAIAACQAANPGGGPALEACITTAQANAFTCRQAAIDASAPGFAPCTQQYVACVRACPAA